MKFSLELEKASVLVTHGTVVKEPASILETNHSQFSGPQISISLFAASRANFECISSPDSQGGVAAHKMLHFSNLIENSGDINGIF